ncbi:hypothetical protein V2J09_023626 [Rumex salicifolius]
MQIKLHLCFLLLAALKWAPSDASPRIAKPGCKANCGGISIPFPFGIGVNCSLDSWFEIDCKASNGTVKPLLSKLGVEVMEVNINYSNEYGSPNVIVGAPPLNACRSDAQIQKLTGIDLTGSPYNFSTQYNVFVMEGCPGSAALVSHSLQTMAGCATVCHSNRTAVSVGECYGVECCQTQIGSVGGGHFPFYQIDFNSQVDSGGGGHDCLVAALVKTDSVHKYAGNLLSVAPVVMSWSWVSKAQPDVNLLANCSRDETTDAVLCECKSGYFGNPYVSDGCQVRKECKKCEGYCHGTWDDTGKLISGTYSCDKRTLVNRPAILGLSIGFGIVLLALGLCRLYYFINTRREMRKKASFFKRNGGFLLQQQLTSNDGFVERTRIFTINELEKATDYFNENRILGQGGQGTVYKGMLTDGRIVAIKKSKQLDESQLEQFINEVAILSQINHKHVVKLLGCCLETEVPLLVYEFIHNGTLSQRIHDQDEDFVVTWKMRLKIAADSAGAISYLHSSSTIPIYHRDIKSSNILLDEKYIAKVADFGSSKTIAIDQTHMTTLVQGTMGYLDPEYFQSYKFTEKSDVYSFGVVLLELLTGKKPIYRTESKEQMNLVTEFLYLIKNSNLNNIIDPRIVKDATEEELKSVVELARRCLCWRGRFRPTMKEVAMALEMIMKSPGQAPPWEGLSLSDEGFSDITMFDMSDTEYVSNPLPNAGVAGSLRIDKHPLLSNTL